MYSLKNKLQNKPKVLKNYIKFYIIWKSIFNKEGVDKMFTLYGSNTRTWAEMTQEERKVFLIIMGIIILGLACYGIYYYFKNNNKK